MHLASMRESYRELSDKTRRLEEAYERLKELDRLKSNVLATVSHELRTPLTSIMGYAEMLLEGIGGPMGREQLEFVETIRAKGDQLLALIMSLLDLSKLESGTAAMSVRRVAIGEVLLDVVQTLTPAAKKKNVRLTVRIDDALPALSADPDRLRQVFLNLAENGLKFTPTGGEVALVATVQPGEELDPFGLVLVAPTRQSIEVRVQDTGIGIPLAQRARVFDAFYQVDQSSTREYGGAGLGLAIVKRLVDAHGGSIRVEETTPHGTTFIVTLPCSSPTIQPLMDSPFSDT
jgi:signal transduction histidine kinase